MTVREQILRLPRRVETLGGQDFSYVKLDDVLALVPDTRRDHQWSFYMNGTFCTLCGAPLGSGTPCR